MSTVRIEYPWPPSILGPNSRAHWGKKIGPKRVSKNAGYTATLERMAALRELPGYPDLDLVAEFYPPLRGGPAPDTDNAIASCKALQDGIALALGINDQALIEWPPRHAERVKGGKVVIEYRPKRGAA